MAKSIEETIILNKIEKLEKREQEYREIDRNDRAEKISEEKQLYINIYNLIEDGYKYRDLCD